MTHIACAYCVVFAAAIIGLVFGSEAIRLLIAGALLLVAPPLWAIIRRAAEATGIERAAGLIRGRRERA